MDHSVDIGKKRPLSPAQTAEHSGQWLPVATGLQKRERSAVDTAVKRPAAPVQYLSTGTAAANDPDREDQIDPSGSTVSEAPVARSQRLDKQHTDATPYR